VLIGVDGPLTNYLMTVNGMACWLLLLVNINQMNRQVHCRATTPKAKGECEDAWCLVGRIIDGGVT